MTSAEQVSGRPDMEPRNIHFEFDEALPVDWHSGEPAVTHFYDALSLTFPEGERFFIDSVRRNAHRILDPDLERRVQGFTAQEAIHSREHVGWFRRVVTMGIATFDFMIAVPILQAWLMAKRGKLARPARPDDLQRKLINPPIFAAD
jgi:predicted metal-dependent hydrolase